MRTIDVTKLGIDRNFLRQCENQKLIQPKKIPSEWIVHEEYTPKEYTQEDVETVWNAYLYRKMGLSYSDIRKLTQGEEISVRDSLSDLIDKYESQIEELKALTQFMRFVKGFGFIPSPPETLLQSRSFKEYLVDFEERINKDNVSDFLRITEKISNADNIEELDDQCVEEYNSVIEKIAPQVTDTDKEDMGTVFISLKGMVDLETDSDEVQELLHKLFDCQKKFANNDDLTPWQFAMSYLFMLSNECDLSVTLKKCLGEEGYDFLFNALISFLEIEEPAKMERIYDRNGEIDDSIVTDQ